MGGEGKGRGGENKGKFKGGEGRVKKWNYYSYSWFYMLLFLEKN